MKLIKDWAYAANVCKKYNLTWNPYVKLGYGSYDWNTRTVYVNPFSVNFISIFMHEVGHHVHNVSVHLPMWLIPENSHELRYSCGYLGGYSVLKVLDAEAKASRFAMKSGKGNKDFLVKAFHTYTSQIFRNTDKSCVVSLITTIVDSCYKNERLINK